jgi:hypothetical protein
MLDVAVSKGTVRARQSAYWFFNDKYGDQGAEYVPIDPRNTADHWPSIPARLTCDVAYSRRVWAVFRRVPKNWVAPAGSYCQILSRWTDGTVRLQVGLSDTTYPDRKQSIDGRFPGWVAEAVRNREILPANVPTKRRRSLRPVLIVLLATAVVLAGYVVQIRLPIGA